MNRTPLKQAKTIDNVFNSAYWHLSQQDFTIEEIRQKLLRKTDKIEWVDKVLAHLIERGYLKTNYEFAVRFCELAYSNEQGNGAIKGRLQQRGVELTDIERAIEHVMFEQNIDLNILASARLSNKYDNFLSTTKEKVYSQMTTKGFTRAQIDYALSIHPQKDTLRSKLSIKAEKADLKIEIIKLYNKGKGKKVILQELTQRLIDVSDFENVVYQLTLSQEVDFYESCQKQLTKKRYVLSDYNEKSKAYAYLMRKGFNSDEIKEAFSAAVDPE